MSTENPTGVELVSGLISKARMQGKNLADVCRAIEGDFDTPPGHIRAIVNLWRYNPPELVQFADAAARQFGLGPIETIILTLPRNRKNAGLFYWLAIEKELA